MHDQEDEALIRETASAGVLSIRGDAAGVPSYRARPSASASHPSVAPTPRAGDQPAQMIDALVTVDS
jgi:hypothetical protein